MSDTLKKRAEVISSFTDHGTGESFVAGATPLIDAGAFANYEAAGLVRAPAAKSATAKRTDAPKPKAKARSQKPARRAATPSPTVPAAPATPPVAGEGSADA